MNEYYDPLGRGPRLMPPPPRPLAPPPPTPPGVMSEGESGRPMFPDVAFEGSRMGIAPLPSIPSSPSCPSPMMYIQQGNNQNHRQPPSNVAVVAAEPYRHQHYNQASSATIRSQPQKHHIVHQHHHAPPQTVRSVSQSPHMFTSSHLPPLSSRPREYNESYVAPSLMELNQRREHEQQNANVQQQNRQYLTSPMNTYDHVHYSQQHIENNSRRPDEYHANGIRNYDQGRDDYEHQSIGATFPPYPMSTAGMVSRSIRSEPSPRSCHPQLQQQPQYHHRLQMSDSENIYNRNDTRSKVYYGNRIPYDSELEQHEYSLTPNDGHVRVNDFASQHYSNSHNEYEIKDRQQQQQQNRNPINDGANRRSSEHLMMQQQQQQQQQYSYRENEIHEYRDPPPPPISTTPDLYINNDPLSPLSIPWCGDGPVIDNNNSSGNRSPQDSEAVCLCSFVDCGNSSPRYERSDSRYGYHPHKYDYHHTSTTNGHTNREGVMIQNPYNNNYTNNRVMNQHYLQYDDRYVVPREVIICSKNDDPAPPQKVFEQRDDVSGSSTIITPSTFANNPHPQQQQQPRRNMPPPFAIPAVREQYSTRNDHHPTLSSIAPNIPEQQQHQWKNNLAHPATTARQQQYSTRNDQPTYNREPYSMSHHARDIPTPNTQNVPNSINSKPPLHSGHHGQQHQQQRQQKQQQQQQYSRLSVVAAEKERRKSKARHQILKEISQATIMRNSSLNDTDRKFWDSQIDTLNQSFKKL